MAALSPRHIVGLSMKKNLLFLRLFLISVLLATSLSAHPELPTLGDPTIRHFDSQQEEALGKAFYTSLRENLDIIDDPQIDHYLTNLANRIVSHSDAAGDHFRFFMVNSKVINAFAGPHGHIGVNSGIVLEARDESQLAGVLAHEISHVSQRHLARAFSRSGASTAASFAAVLAAVLLSTQDPAAGQAVLLAGIAGNQQASINFTRQNEYEADRIGIELLAESGINPKGMVGFFELLLSRGNGLTIEYLRTHPLNSNRVAEAKNRLRPKFSSLPSDSVDFRFCKARLEVLVSDDTDTFLQQAEHGDDIDAYRRALAYIRIHRYDKAIETLEPLAKKNPHPWIKIALAEAFDGNEQIKKAMQTLKGLAQFYPDYLPVTLAYAKILMDNKLAQESIKLLLRQLQTDDSAIVHKMLARAYFANGQISAALEATGNQYEREGYTELAIQQYENALQQPSLNNAARQRLQTKKKSLESLHRE